MKITLIFLVFLTASKSDWYETRCSEMAEIDMNGAVTRKRSLRIERGTASLTKTKFDKFRKLRVEFSDQGAFGNSEMSYYHHDTFLFAARMIWFGEVPQKGVRQATVPSCELVEIKTIFETKESGIKLKRSLHYFENSDMDSLLSVFSKMLFDTLPMKIVEHERSVKSYKRFKSMR